MIPAEFGPALLAMILRQHAPTHHHVEHASRSEVRTAIHAPATHAPTPAPVVHAAPTGVYAQAHEWANEPFSIAVANCESGGSGPTYTGNPHVVAANGHYGKWQFAPATYASIGGVGNAAYASEAEQDYRAYLLWRSYGWGQWQCAQIVS